MKLLWAHLCDYIFSKLAFSLLNNFSPVMPAGQGIPGPGEMKHIEEGEEGR